jgi:ATP-dependent DNA helicase RecG
MTRSAESLPTLLAQLLAAGENEVVEFKEANDNFSLSDIGKYFSALANEANLRGTGAAWLVFGVHDKTRTVVGTAYREDRQRLMGLKQQIADGVDPSTTFRDIHELRTQAGRVLLFEIPPAPRGMPLAWQGHCFARNHDSLTGLSFSKQDEIRNQGAGEDWSAVVCPKATLQDLDPAALAKARDLFAAKYGGRIPEATIRAWSDDDFLAQAKLTVDGGITRAALLLLGKPQSTHHFSPFVAELSWKLEGPERAYEHFHPPFLLETSLLFQRIRNLRLSLLPPGQLIPVDVQKYEQAIVLEALHNCIAHQDYRACERVLVIERPGELEFSNAGGFYDGVPDDYVLGNRSPKRYRNRLLAEAMVTLRMMDTMGYGIREVMFKGQARRYLPLPDFDLSEANHVTLRLPGRFIDENYSRILLTHPDFSLADILALDRVQKHQAVSDEALRALRRQGLVEGRKPALHVSALVAAATDSKAQYIRQRSQGDTHYRQLILDYLQRFKSATRSELRDMLLPTLPTVLSPEQKEIKLKNLIAALSREGRIVRHGGGPKACWQIRQDRINP